MLDCRREPSKGVRGCRIRSFLSNLASITGTRSSVSPGPTTAQKLTTSSIYQQGTKTSQGPTPRAKRSLAAWQEHVPKTDEGGMQNRCATRKELELQSFQRWIASSCPGGRGWVYHGELRCHSRLASQNRSTTKSSYGRITSGAYRCGRTCQALRCALLVDNLIIVRFVSNETRFKKIDSNFNTIKVFRLSGLF